MSSDSSVRPMSASEVSGWDAEADVIVVGFGCAGASAAFEAAAAGADVLILERAGGAGGASAIAGGEIYLGGGTPIQTACGFDDSAEDMFEFLMAACGPHADETKVSLYSEQSLEHFDWLVARGVPFKPSLWTEPTYVPPTDDGLMWMGEHTHPFNEIARPAPRGHRPQTPGSGGWLLMDRLATDAARAGAQTRADTAVLRLVTERDGSVVGVVARQYGEIQHVRARRGVVLAAGGFVYNDDMLRQYAPTLLGHAKVGTDHDDGRAIRMAQAVGAAVKRMDSGQSAIMASPQLLARGILVNARGDRFINEDTYPGRVGQMTLFHQGGRGFLIVDEETFESVPEAERMGMQPTAVCATVAELEAEIGLPERSLQTTVEVYNHHAERGEDPICHKISRWVKPLGSPIGAIDIRGRRNIGSDEVADMGTGFAVFTLGGVHSTVDGEVLDLDGDPIPGLYAAGRTTSGIQAWGYISGTSLGESTFFGRRAGRAVARRS